MEFYLDRPGRDYRDFALAAARPELCQQACANEAQCRAYTYVKPGKQGPQAQCWLKADVPNPVPNACCVSAIHVVGAPLPAFPTIALDMDRPGLDYKHFALSTPHPGLCHSACGGDPACQAYTYVKPGKQGPQAQCWLKSSVPNSNPNQCCVSGVKHGIAPPPHPAPFDLVWDAVDPNGLPLNPKWGWRVTPPGSQDNSLPDANQLCDGFPYIYRDPSNPSAGISGVSLGSPPCTTQPVTFDTPSLSLNAIICSFGPQAGKLQGHVNWYPTTYEGPIYWAGHADWTHFDDDDYNIDLAPPGLTTLVAGQGLLHTEFDSDETIDHFHTPWWESFHRVVDGGAGNSISGADAILIGLLGLDCAHSCKTELHPVWAMAIHDPIQRSLSDDVWAIFVRNWGNEGYCSSHNHLLGLTTIKFRLPWRPGATSVSVATGTQFLYGPDDLDDNDKRQVSGPNVEYAPNEGVLVTFTLPRPEAGARMNGELHLQWSGLPLNDPCAALRARLTTLLAELSQLVAGIPANKADIPGVVEAAERRIEQWHQAHDQEIADLRQQLAACQRSGLLPTAALSRSVDLATTEPDEAEGRLEALYEKVPPAKRQPLIRKLEKRVAYDQSVARRSGEAKKVPHLPSTVQSQPPQVFVVDAHRKAERDRLRRDSMCAALDGNIPDFPGACAQPEHPEQR